MIPDTLFLLPGLDGTGTLFADLIRELPPTLRFTIAEYPADRFLSYSKLVSFVTEMIPTSPFVLVAESFSTPLAVMVAARRPAKLAGLVLSAGFITNPIGRWALTVRALAKPRLISFSPPGLVLEHFLIGADPSKALKAQVRHALRLVNPEVLAQRVCSVLECDARGELVLTTVPILYIQAENDRLVPSQCFREIQRLRPDSVLVSIPAPHLVLQREPRRAAQAILRFVQERLG